MEDNFDKILANKIKDITKNSEYPYNPKHWDMLIAKKKKKKRILFYWQAAAFLIFALLAGSIGNYFYKATTDEKFKPEIILDKINDSLRIDSIKRQNQIFITASPTDSLNSLDSKIGTNDSAKSNIHTPSKSRNVIVLNEKDKNSNDLNENVQSQLVKEKLDKQNNVIAQNIEILKTNDSISLNEKLADNNLNLNKKEDSLAHKKDLLTLLENETKVVTEDKIDKKSIKLGVNLSPLINYNQSNESTDVGFLAGVLLEIPVSKKFDINMGVYYSDQTLNLNTSPKYASDVVSYRSSSQLINKQAVIKGVEIPLNVKYNFKINKKNIFVSTGFSSTSYIKQSIEENFIVNDRSATIMQDSYGNNVVKYELVQKDEKVITPNDANKFNFANILNFSFGLEVPINKQQQSLIIEPYFKYSLKPTTVEKLDFSSFGMHLRYNFNIQKK